MLILLLIPQTILHGTERSGRSAAGPMLPGDVQSNDGHRAMDFPVRRPQNTERVSGHRLHATHAGRSRLSAQQLQVLSQSVSNITLKQYSFFFIKLSSASASPSRRRPWPSWAPCAVASIASSRTPISIIATRSTSSRANVICAIVSRSSSPNTVWCPARICWFRSRTAMRPIIIRRQATRRRWPRRRRPACRRVGMSGRRLASRWAPMCRAKVMLERLTEAEGAGNERLSTQNNPHSIY